MEFSEEYFSNVGIAEVYTNDNIIIDGKQININFLSSIFPSFFISSDLILSYSPFSLSFSFDSSLTFSFGSFS